MTSPDDVLAQALARAKRNREKFGIQTEMERILELPVQVFDGAALVPKWTEALRRKPSARPLRPIQAEMLETCAWAAEQDDPIGALANIAVGGGKTLIFLLAPMVFKAQRPVLIIPTKMRAQLEDDMFE